MATNEFKPFSTAGGANIISQTDYEALAALSTGFSSGVAKAKEVNKVLRQASFIAAALAQYTANKSGLDVVDDGDLNGFIAKMSAAFGKDFQALDATLTALAGLATGANKLPYFTGKETASQTDLTSVGRDIIGKSTIADILTYLQLGEAAKKAVVTSATDVTAGRVPVVGWQGLGGDAIQPTGNDFNQLSPSGFIQGQDNTPVYPSLFMGFNVRHGGSYQLTIVGRNKRYFAQSCEAGEFQGWDEFYTTANKPTAADVGALASNGTAAAATKLAAARQINGVAFDGSKNINLPLIGYDQTWQVFTSRVANTTYTNSTGLPICVSVTVAMATGNNAATASLNINGTLIQSAVSRYSDNNKVVFVTAIIPAGATYSVSGVQGTISTWAELR